MIAILIRALIDTVLLGKDASEQTGGEL